MTITIYSEFSFSPSRIRFRITRLTFHSGQRYAIATETTPLPNATVGVEVMTALFETFYNTTSEVLLDTGVIGTIAFQPMPRTITSKAIALGGVRLKPIPSQN